MKTPISLTARMSLLFAASAACVLLAASLLFECAVGDQFLGHDREELYGKMKLIGDELGMITTHKAIATLPLRLNDIGLEHPGMAISVAAADRTVLFSTGPAGVVKHLLQDPEIGKSQPVIWKYLDHTYRFVSNHLALGISGAQPVIVAIALDITDDQNFFATFRKFLWSGMLLVVLAMGWIGWIVVHKGLSPLHEVSDMVANVSAQRLDCPVPTAGVPRELQELMSAFNRMLTRLDDSFRRLSEFSSDIAHELRTPINNLMIQTQVTLSRERSADDYRNILHSNQEEFERLSRMISGILFLAKADNKLVVPERESIELHTEVERLREYYEALASDRRVRLIQSGAATVFADRLMIQRAISNLLSNAIRFTPEGKAIEVSIKEDTDWATVAVANPGPTIPAEHLTNIFERLYRVDVSRREGSTDNVGLGLSIAKSIVEMHGGTIGAESANGHTCFTIIIPRLQVA